MDLTKHPSLRPSEAEVHAAILEETKRSRVLRLLQVRAQASCHSARRRQEVQEAEQQELQGIRRQVEQQCRLQQQGRWQVLQGQLQNALQGVGSAHRAAQEQAAASTAADERLDEQQQRAHERGKRALRKERRSRRSQDNKKEQQADQRLALQQRERLRAQRVAAQPVPATVQQESPMPPMLPPVLVQEVGTLATSHYRPSPSIVTRHQGGEGEDARVMAEQERLRLQEEQEEAEREREEQELKTQERGKRAERKERVRGLRNRLTEAMDEQHLDAFLGGADASDFCPSNCGVQQSSHHTHRPTDAAHQVFLPTQPPHHAHPSTTPLYDIYPPVSPSRYVYPSIDPSHDVYPSTHSHHVYPSTHPSHHVSPPLTPPHAQPRSPPHHGPHTEQSPPAGGISSCSLQQRRDQRVADLLRQQAAASSSVTDYSSLLQEVDVPSPPASLSHGFDAAAALRQADQLMTAVRQMRELAAGGGVGYTVSGASADTHAASQAPNERTSSDYGVGRHDHERASNNAAPSVLAGNGSVVTANGTDGSWTDVSVADGPLGDTAGIAVDRPSSVTAVSVVDGASDKLKATRELRRQVLSQNGGNIYTSRQLIRGVAGGDTADSRGSSYRDTISSDDGSNGGRHLWTTDSLNRHNAATVPVDLWDVPGDREEDKENLYRRDNVAVTDRKISRVPSSRVSDGEDVSSFEEVRVRVEFRGADEGDEEESCSSQGQIVTRHYEGRNEQRLSRIIVENSRIRNGTKFSDSTREFVRDMKRYLGVEGSSSSEYLSPPDVSSIHIPQHIYDNLILLRQNRENIQSKLSSFRKIRSAVQDSMAATPCPQESLAGQPHSTVSSGGIDSDNPSKTSDGSADYTGGDVSCNKPILSPSNEFVRNTSNEPIINPSNEPIARPSTSTKPITCTPIRMYTENVKEDGNGRRPLRRRHKFELQKKIVLQNYVKRLLGTKRAELQELSHSAGEGSAIEISSGSLLFKLLPDASAQAAESSGDTYSGICEGGSVATRNVIYEEGSGAIGSEIYEHEASSSPDHSGIRDRSSAATHRDNDEGGSAAVHADTCEGSKGSTETCSIGSSGLFSSREAVHGSSGCLDDSELDRIPSKLSDYEHTSNDIDDRNAYADDTDYWDFNCNRVGNHYAGIEGAINDPQPIIYETSGEVGDFTQTRTRTHTSDIATRLPPQQSIRNQPTRESARQIEHPRVSATKQSSVQSVKSYTQSDKNPVQSGKSCTQSGTVSSAALSDQSPSVSLTSFSTRDLINSNSSLTLPSFPSTSTPTVVTSAALPMGGVSPILESEADHNLMLHSAAGTDNSLKYPVTASSDARQIPGGIQYSSDSEVFVHTSYEQQQASKTNDTGRVYSDTTDQSPTTTDQPPTTTDHPPTTTDHPPTTTDPAPTTSAQAGIETATDGTILMADTTSEVSTFATSSSLTSDDSCSIAQTREEVIRKQRDIYRRLEELNKIKERYLRQHHQNIHYQQELQRQRELNYNEDSKTTSNQSEERRETADRTESSEHEVRDEHRVEQQISDGLRYGVLLQDNVHHGDLHNDDRHEPDHQMQQPHTEDNVHEPAHQMQPPHTEDSVHEPAHQMQPPHTEDSVHNDDIHEPEQQMQPTHTENNNNNNNNSVLPTQQSGQHIGSEQQLEQPLLQEEEPDTPVSPKLQPQYSYGDTPVIASQLSEPRSPATTLSQQSAADLHATQHNHSIPHQISTKSDSIAAEAVDATTNSSGHATELLPELTQMSNFTSDSRDCNSYSDQEGRANVSTSRNINLSRLSTANVSLEKILEIVDLRKLDGLGKASLGLSSDDITGQSCPTSNVTDYSDAPSRTSVDSSDFSSRECSTSVGSCEASDKKLKLQSKLKKIASIVSSSNRISTGSHCPLETAASSEASVAGSVRNCGDGSSSSSSSCNFDEVLRRFGWARGMLSKMDKLDEKFPSTDSSTV